MPKFMRRRYLALKLDTEQVSHKDVVNAIWSSVLQLFGEYGASQANLYVIEQYSQKDSITVRCSLNALEMVRAAISAITEISGKPAVLHILMISGTLKTIREKTKH